MLTLIEAAERLGVTAATLRQKISHGKLRARKIGTVWIVSEREVERYRRDHSSHPSGSRMYCR